MTYTVEIFEPPPGESRPADLAAVVALVDRLHQMPSARHEKFHQLIANLLRRFPDITSDEAADLPEFELAWSDGPLGGECDSGVYVLGLGRLDEVRAFVVEQANALGLAVFDTQAAGAWYPGGVGFGNTALDEPPGKDDPPTIREVGNAVFDRLAPRVAARGFKPARSSLKFTRKFKGGFQRLAVSMDVYENPCRFGLNTHVDLAEVSDLRDRLLLYPHATERFPTTMLRQVEWLKAKEEFIEPGKIYGYRVGSWEELDRVLEHATGQVETVLLPILEESMTVQGFDRLLNTQPYQASVYFKSQGEQYLTILVAHLAGNPRLPELCALVPKIHENDARKRAQMCVDYVQGQA
jgi:hypothetical protein